MLNTKKLLYILPDLTYLAELLPGKKEHEYAIQSFRQINGEFLDDNEFIANNIQKLFTKIDENEYHLILPDFLFTNTIVNVDNSPKVDAVTYVKEKLLPDLNLSDKTHEIEITVLTSFKGKSKVQISAIEKELLSPIRTAAEKSKVTISAISPLSWTIKAIVSLEPSITVLQIGNNLYSAQHYIGVDQTNNFPVDEFTSITETIKTLKGAEPSIQTIYLASSSLIEEKLKKDLSGTLPIQQLATYKEEDSKMPSYVKYIIESCMKTLSISDFPVPKFKIGKVLKNDNEVKSALKNDEKNTEIKEVQEKSSSKNPASIDLPEPSKVLETTKVADITKVVTMSEDKKTEDKELKTNEEQINNEDEKSTTDEKPNLKEDVQKTDSTDLEEKSSIDIKPVLNEKSDEDKKTSIDNKLDTNNKKENETINKPSDEEIKDVDLAQFAGKEEEDEKSDDNDKQISDITKKTNKVIKNSSGVNNMLKMVFITLAVFFITIAIGIGVGLGLLKISDKNPNENADPVVVVEPEATPEVSATATPEPEVEIDKEELSILVVNATTKAGYAGKIKKLLTASDIPDTTAGNAEGDYESETDYILMTKENNALKELLEESTDLSFEFSSEVKVEDPDGDYDAVIVLTK